MKKVYISGRISGLPRDQYMRLFFISASMLKKKGYEPVNPTRFWLSKWYKQLTKVLGHKTAYNLTLFYDLWRLIHCDLIYKIPGWQQSRGANIESCVAYHYKVWPINKDVIAKIDKRLNKMIIKFENNEKDSTFTDRRHADGELQNDD